MTAIASVADWTFLEDERVVGLINRVARQVSSGYKDMALSMLAEPEDVYQEALIIVAQHPEWVELSDAQIRQYLWRDLQNLYSRNRSTAQRTEYLRPREGTEEE